jgi:hypothetical protein
MRGGEQYVKDGEFDLDVQKVAANYEDPKAARGTTTIVWTTVKSFALSCTGCIEVGKTSDLCNSDNCSALTHCADCYE